MPQKIVAINLLDPTIIATAVTAVATTFLAYLTYRLVQEQRRTRGTEARVRAATFNPVPEITLSGLPPYTNPNSRTTLDLTNVGNCSMENPNITMHCSWCPRQTIHVRCDDDVIVQNEHKSFSIQLPEPPIGQHEIRVIVVAMNAVTHELGSWSHEQQIMVNGAVQP